MNEFTHVILDEVHERDQETDFCLLLVKMLQSLNSKGVKIVLMSATAESKKFANYFARKPPLENPHQQLQPAPIFKVKGRTFRVQDFYLDDLRELGQVRISTNLVSSFLLCLTIR